MNSVYRLLFDLVFRRMDPERAHEVAFRLIRVVGAGPGACASVVAASFAASDRGAVPRLRPPLPVAASASPPGSTRTRSASPA